jgi:predicted membrane channel-forming protein YqfA (hemolysin III family)
MALNDKELEELVANVIHERRKNTIVVIASIVLIITTIGYIINNDKLFIFLYIVTLIFIILVFLIYHNYPNFLKRKVKLMGKRTDHSGP